MQADYATELLLGQQTSQILIPMSSQPLDRRRRRGVSAASSGITSWATNLPNFDSDVELSSGARINEVGWLRAGPDVHADPPRCAGGEDVRVSAAGILIPRSRE